VVLGLGITQTLSWASSYYLPALLAASMAHDLGLATHWLLAAFSWALVVSALMGPVAGWAIDRWGGRPVMSLASVGFAAGLGLLSQAQGAGQLVLAWSLLGMAMAGGLYEAAFATVVKFDPAGARRAITGITLMGGLASTVGWPLTAWLSHELGWRGACMVWAALHVGINLPIHLWLRSRSVQPDKAQANSAQALSLSPSSLPGALPLPAHHHRRAAALLASTFALTWFISTAMAAHLPVLLQAQGMTLATAVWLGSLLGPAQVLARMAEYSLLKHVHPLLSARLAAAMHPLAALLLLALGAPAGVGCVIMHGAGNGVLTIAQGSLPLVFFGPQGYGLRQGMLMLPARFVQALSPLLFGLALQSWGAQALWLTAALGAACLGALLCLPKLSPLVPPLPVALPAGQKKQV
jgi:MFS family permease